AWTGTSPAAIRGSRPRQLQSPASKMPPTANSEKVKSDTPIYLFLIRAARSSAARTSTRKTLRQPARQKCSHPAQVVLEPVGIHPNGARECRPRPRAIAVAKSLQSYRSQDAPGSPPPRIDQPSRRNPVALLQIRLENVQCLRVVGQPLELPWNPREPPYHQRLGDIAERPLLAHLDPEIYVLEAEARAAQFVAIAAAFVVRGPPDQRGAGHYRPQPGQQFMQGRRMLEAVADEQRIQRHALAVGERRVAVHERQRGVGVQGRHRALEHRRRPHVVGVEKSQIFARRMPRAVIARRRRSAVGLLDEPHAVAVIKGVLLNDCAGLIGRAVVNANDFKILDRLPDYAVQGASDSRGRVVGGNDYRDAGHRLVSFFMVF